MFTGRPNPVTLVTRFPLNAIAPPLNPTTRKGVGEVTSSPRERQSPILDARKRRRKGERAERRRDEDGEGGRKNASSPGGE